MGERRGKQWISNGPKIIKPQSGQELVTENHRESNTAAETVKSYSI